MSEPLPQAPLRGQALLQLIRVQQWVKNLFLFVPTFFAGKLFHAAGYRELLAGFFAYSLLASAVYILNDWRDRTADRLHPRKRFRPLAAGTVRPGQALALLALLVLLSLLLAVYVGRVEFYGILLLYLLLNLLYTLYLKEIPVLDITIIASGFLLRVLAGGVLAQVPISHWLQIMTFLLALFLAIAKRRDDVLLLERTGQEMRKSIAGYNLPFVNTSMGILASIVIVAYIQYTTSPEVTQRLGSERVYLTALFVLLGMLRYLQLTLVAERSESPTRVLLRDSFTQLTLLAWLLSFYLILYGPPWAALWAEGWPW